MGIGSKKKEKGKSQAVNAGRGCPPHRMHGLSCLTSHLPPCMLSLLHSSGRYLHLETVQPATLIALYHRWLLCLGLNMCRSGLPERHRQE